MTMGFFSLAAEIRLKIYSELLVLSEPIVLGSSMHLIRYERNDLYPAILRVNKQAYEEACPLLYSSNCFQFPDVYDPKQFGTNSAYLSPFLRQIGHRASSIRHICILSPTLGGWIKDSAKLQKAHIKTLELIRDNCTSITTLELLVDPDRANFGLEGFSPSAVEALDLLNTHFQTILSLKKIILNFQGYDYEYLSDQQRKKIRDCGWAVKFTELPKRGWITWDGFECENRKRRDAWDECHNLDLRDELRRLVEEEEEEEEEEEDEDDEEEWRRLHE